MLRDHFIPQQNLRRIEKGKQLSTYRPAVRRWEKGETDEDVIYWLALAFCCYFKPTALRRGFSVKICATWFSVNDEQGRPWIIFRM
jgi:hypothetical protein